MSHRVFITYHHANDQAYKDNLVKFGEDYDIFIDQSVDTGDISDELSDERIREKIRDEYLRDSSVTIVLVGVETKGRKHIDWEIYSSMIDGQKNKKSGILVINLPTVDNGKVWAPHGDREKQLVYPDEKSWISVYQRVEIERLFPYMPSRVVDNLVSGVKISVTRWEALTVERLKFLIDTAFNSKRSCNYDLRAPMRRKNT